MIIQLRLEQDSRGEFDIVRAEVNGEVTYEKEGK